MNERRHRPGLIAFALVVVLGATACDQQVPPRAHQAADLTSAIGALPGVVSANADFADNVPEGQVHFWITVEVAPEASSDQVGAITDRYLQGLKSVDYSGYRTELDIRQGDNRFAVDSGELPVLNERQIVEQSRNWIWLREEFPGATLDARSTIARAPEVRDVGHPFAATLNLPDAATYKDVAAAATTLARKFPQLGSGVWSMHAGKRNPADINTFRRFPNAGELRTWNALNADQDIPHIVALSINAPMTPPLWISEQTTVADGADGALAAELAERHLPVVATLAPPVLYTSGSQLQAARNSVGKSTGPIAVTLGGCTPRLYSPQPAEQALIDRYEQCGG